MLFPTKSTWIKAVKNGAFSTWPGLTEDLINKYYDIWEATIKGHMQLSRQGIQSTKINREPKCMAHAVALLDYYNEIHTDLTGRTHRIRLRQ